MVLVWSDTELHTAVLSQIAIGLDLLGQLEIIEDRPERNEERRVRTGDCMLQKYLQLSLVFEFVFQEACLLQVVNWELDAMESTVKISLLSVIKLNSVSLVPLHGWLKWYRIRLYYKTDRYLLL